MKQPSVDKRVQLYKAVAGLIPGGSFVVEYMIDKIPNKRMDRLFEFVEELNKRIEKLENKEHLNSEEFTYLAENAIIESVNSKSSDRKNWLASIAIPKNSEIEDVEWDFRVKAVYILSTLDDNDVHCLIQYTDCDKKISYEHSLGKHQFISAKDRHELPDYDLFLRNLYNQTLDVRRSALASHGLIICNDKNKYEITENGRLFIYLITEKYPRW